MKPSGLRAPVGSSALVCLAVVLGAVCAAHLSDRGLQVWTGAVAGLVMGLAGLAAAVVCMRSSGRAGNAAFWGAWGAGLAARVLVMSAAALVFWRVWPECYAAPMLSMAAAWLVVHGWEIGWLLRRRGEADRG